MRYRPKTTSRLDLLIAALGGPAEAARMMGRDRSTLARWRNGSRPLPAWAAVRMRKLAIEINQQMVRLAYDLQTDIRDGENRRAHMIAKGKTNFYQNASRGEPPIHTVAQWPFAKNF